MSATTRCRGSGGRAALLALAVLLAAPAFAGEAVSNCAAAASPWDEMWRRPVALREGVTVRAYALDEPRLMKAYVVKVDLSTPGIGFTASDRDGRWGERVPNFTNRVLRVATRRERTDVFMSRRRAEGRNVEVAVNTAPWGPWPPPRGNTLASLHGWNVADGVEISYRRNPKKGAFFLVRRDGRAEIRSSLAPSETNDVAFAMCGFAVIMTNGVQAAVRNADDLHPRTAFGLTADRRTLVLLAVDGRQPGYSLGASLGDLCAIMRREGVVDAVNMDGGGSTSLVVYDHEKDRPRMLNHHRGDARRANAVNFGITF